MEKTIVVTVLVAFICWPGVDGHGSHQHMAKHHAHPVPVKTDGAAVKSVLEEKQMIQDGDHLMEELKDIYTPDQIKKMSVEEVEFHYFKLHDYDGNNLLDGLEIMAAISHIVPHDPDLDLAKKGEDGYILSDVEKLQLERAKERRDEQNRHFIEMIDKMFEDNDRDKDGYINYAEFAKTRRPDALYKNR